jgi:hypothetical protein
MMLSQLHRVKWENECELERGQKEVITAHTKVCSTTDAGRALENHKKCVACMWAKTKMSLSSSNHGVLVGD